MAKIPRVFQKIFASAATNNGQFGSGQTGAKVTSNDLPTLMSLSAWASGWLGAVIGGSKFPPLEEFQALTYIQTTQLAYLFQEGVPDWDTSTTYWINGIVKKPGTMQLFGSLTNSNQGNALPVAPASNSNWKFLIDLGAVGTYLQVANNLSDVASAATSRTNLGAPPVPIASSGVGQIAAPTIVAGIAGTITLPPGGTWMYYAYNLSTSSSNGQGVTGVAAGGTVVLTAGTSLAGDIENVGGFCWRLA